ncbi:MAG: glycosyltransferase [Niastella sp.]|nr:glycosyltransferase [Niastella sp.]
MTVSSEQPSTILFISTFPPVKCGIASFTQDLVQAIGRVLTKDIEINICALDVKSNEGLYKAPVSMVMDSHSLDDCIETAAAINSDVHIKMICVEHEFGLYGGELGEYLLGFLAMIEKPFVIRYHTVLPDPDAKRLALVRKINQLADKVIVMTRNSARLLLDAYGLSAEKIVVIPHGTHNNSQMSVRELKRKYQLDNRQVLCTFGLLSPNKGIEEGILAMRKICAHFPGSMYIVLGQTHPNLIAHEGERYREYLQELIEQNSLQNNVRLVNEYVPVDKLMEYLALTDIYLFTSKDPNQAVSGTFLYAMSAGCAIISNSFVLAHEMLDTQTGIILTTNNEDELAEKAIQLLGNEPLRKRMGQNAFLRTRDTTWQKVSKKHATLFLNMLQAGGLHTASFSQLAN